MTKHIINILFFVLLVGFSFFWSGKNQWLFLLIAFIFFFLVMSAGVLFLRFNYFTKAQIKVKKPKVLLTFDDGPNPNTTPVILDILKENKIKAIFFVIGREVEKHPDLLKRIVEEGHLIGNHSYSHPVMFALLGQQKVINEIQKLQSVLNIHSVSTSMFRPPIGYSNPRIARAVKKLNLTIVGWNRRSYDTVISNPIKLSKRLVRLSSPGSIILMHDNLKQTSEALANYIHDAKEKGIIFVELGEKIEFPNESI